MSQASISIDVPDLEEAAEFYCQALGCKKLRDQGNMTIVALGSLEIYLLERADGTNPIADTDVVRTYQRHWTPIHIDFGVDDVDAVADRILKHGGSVEGKESGDWGAIAYCVDPYGHGFCIIDE